MTYQSSPYYPIIFPEQAPYLNRFGVEPLPANYVKHASLMPAGHEAHPSWKRQADHLVMAGLQNNRDKEYKMLQGMPSIKGHAGTTSRYRFTEPFYTQISGGTVRTKEAENDVRELLHDRIAQYERIANTEFGSVADYRLESKLTPSDTYQLDTLFANLLGSLDSGVIGTKSISIVNSIISMFLSIADKLPAHKFSQYLNALTQTTMILQDVNSRSILEESESDLRIVVDMATRLQDLLRYMSEFQRYLGAPSSTKAMVLSGIRSKLLSEVLAKPRTSRTLYENPAVGPENEYDGEDDLASYISPGTSGFTDSSSSAGPPPGPRVPIFTPESGAPVPAPRPTRKLRLGPIFSPP